MTFLLIHHEMPGILSPIWPGQGAIAMHRTFTPLSLVLSPVSPRVLAIAPQMVLDKLSNIGVSILPLELPLTVFIALKILALVN